MNGLGFVGALSFAFVIAPIAAGLMAYSANRFGRRRGLFAAFGLLALIAGAAYAIEFIGRANESSGFLSLVRLAGFYALPVWPGYPGGEPVGPMIENLLVLWIPLAAGLIYAQRAIKPRPVIGALVALVSVVGMFALGLVLVFVTGAPTN